VERRTRPPDLALGVKGPEAGRDSALDTGAFFDTIQQVVERYPDIKSNQNFIALQSQLEGTENRIAVSRRDYNEAVQDYNTSLRTFPTVIWAKTVHGGSEPMQLFSATEAAQTAPGVNFDALQPGGPAPAVAPGAAPPAVPAAP